MGPKTTNQPLKWARLAVETVREHLLTCLEKHLKDSSSDETVEQPDNRIVDVPKAPDPDLHTQNDEDRNQTAQQRSKPDWDNFLPKGVCKLRVHDLSI